MKNRWCSTTDAFSRFWFPFRVQTNPTRSATNANFRVSARNFPVSVRNFPVSVRNFRATDSSLRGKDRSFQPSARNLRVKVPNFPASVRNLPAKVWNFRPTDRNFPAKDRNFRPKDSIFRQPDCIKSDTSRSSSLSQPLRCAKRTNSIVGAALCEAGAVLHLLKDRGGTSCGQSRLYKKPQPTQISNQQSTISN